MTQGVLLCVDDDTVVLDSLRVLLRNYYKSKHIIEVAQSAEEGLEVLDDLCCAGLVPLVIISDCLMPGMKGDDFLIEAHKRFPYVIKVMLSGQAADAAVKRARNEANLYQFFSKPWDGDELIACIDSGLEKYASEFQEEKRISKDK